MHSSQSQQLPNFLHAFVAVSYSRDALLLVVDLGELVHWVRLKDLRVHQGLLEGVQSKHHVVVGPVRLQDDLHDPPDNFVLDQGFEVAVAVPEQVGHGRNSVGDGVWVIEIPESIGENRH